MDAKTTPFWFALATAILAILGLEAWSASRTDPARLLTLDALSLLAHEKDDHGYLVRTALNAASDTDVNADAVSGKSVYLIGGSTLREGLLPDPVLSRDYWTAREGARITTLFSFDQTMAETARVLSNLPLRKGDAVVIDVNPRRMSFGPETLNGEAFGSRISLMPYAPLTPLIEKIRSRERGVDPPPRVRPALAQHRLFARQWLEGRLPSRIKTAWSDLVGGVLTAGRLGDLFAIKPRRLRQFIRYAYGSAPLSDARKDAIARAVAATRPPQYFENREFSFELLRVLVASLREQGVTVILLEMPRSARSKSAYGPVWIDFHERLAAVVETIGARHIDLLDMAIPEDGYYDLEHVLRARRPALSKAVMDALAETIAPG